MQRRTHLIFQRHPLVSSSRLLRCCSHASGVHSAVLARGFALVQPFLDSCRRRETCDSVRLYLHLEALLKSEKTKSDCYRRLNSVSMPVDFICMERRCSRFSRVCVFCGSSSGNKSVFSDAALDLGKVLVERKIDLVYGGGSVGLMGLISQTVFNGGCHVIGVIPKALMPQEISGQTVGEVRAVADMHERKAEMAREADAFVALPGGYGTFEELLEMITWSQLGIHDKPIGLLNVDGYYNPLLALFDKGVEEGFIRPRARNIIVSAPNARELVTRMEDYEAVHDRVAPRQSWEMEHLGFTR